jgi:hypothetical protein
VLKLYANNTYTVLATSPVITVSAPAVMSFTVSATAVSPGTVVTATIANGPGNAQDWVGLYLVGGTAEVDWKFLNGSKTSPAAGLTNATVSFTMPTLPGTYILKFYANNSFTLLAASPPIASANSGFTVSATTVAPGESVTATVVGGPGNAKDWVALYAVGNPTELDWKFLNGSRTAPATGVTSATLSFTLPMAPGNYTLKFYSNNTYTILSIITPITVTSPLAPVTFTVSETVVAPGATVTATIANGPGNAMDWVGLYRVGSSVEVDWKFMNGARTAPAAGTTGAVLTFTLPATPGAYTLRFYSNNTYNVLAAITVTAQ